MSALPRTLLLIIFLALLVRVILLVALLTNFGEEGLFTSDSYGFHQTGRGIALGHGFTRAENPPYLPEAYFPPLYPLLISGSLLLSDSILPLIVIQIILSSLLPLLVWRFGRSLASPRAATLAAALTAFEPLMITWSLLLLTEVVAGFFLLLAVLFFWKLISNWRWYDALFSGLFLALSILTRPQAQFLFIFGLLFLIIYSLIKRWHVEATYFLANLWRRGYKFPKSSEREAASERSGGDPLASEENLSTPQPVSEKHVAEGNNHSIFVTAIFTLTFLLTLSPWLIRNYYHFETLSISTTGLRNIYTSLGSSVLTLHTGRPFPEVREDLLQDFAQKYGVTVRDIKENPVLGKTLAKEGIAILKGHPQETMELGLLSLWVFFTQDLYTDYLQRFLVIPRFQIDFSPSLLLKERGPMALAELIWERLGWYSIIPLVGRILWISLTMLAVIGVLKGLRSNNKSKVPAAMAAVIILYYALTTIAAGFSDEGRMRYPVNPFIFLLASSTLISIYTVLYRYFRNPVNRPQESRIIA